MMNNRSLFLKNIPTKQAINLALALTISVLIPSSLAHSATKAQDIAKDIEQFCGNIVDPARDRRYLLQRVELGKLQTGVDERIAILEEKKNEYKEWLDKRNQFVLKAEEGLVNIFRKMKPDAAAKQLELLNENIAAAIVMKLNASLASRIFNEMKAEKAAKLATIISASAAKPKLDNPS